LATSLIEKTKKAKKFLADKAYDSAELRGNLKKRGTKAVIPSKRNRKQP
jgi:putative transposase